MTVESLKDLYIEQLRDLYNAENQLADALPSMVNMASSDELVQAFEDHLEETQEQQERLERIFRNLGEDPTGEKCEAMEGLIREAKEIAQESRDADALDAALIAQAQRIEHYEIAGYGTVRTYAHQLDRSDDVNVLKETLGEEKAADQKLTKIAEQIVNPKAVAV
jgi:ferritin-like metal-binding protein YciE